MNAELDNQERVLRAAMKIISDSYLAAETVNGAYQLTKEEIQNLYQGNFRWLNLITPRFISYFGFA